MIFNRNQAYANDCKTIGYKLRIITISDLTTYSIMKKKSIRKT